MANVNEDQMKETLRLHAAMTMQKAFESCAKVEATQHFINTDDETKCIYSIR